MLTFRPFQVELNSMRYQIFVRFIDDMLTESYLGFALLFGTAVLSVDVAFTRIRHDAHKRYDRFGDKAEKVCRYVYIWANKGEKRC